MSQILIHESRRLVFPLDTIVDAVIDLEREHARWPVRGAVMGARISRTAGLALTIKRPDAGTPDERCYSLTILAAAIIAYCAKMRVPIPRNATKSVKVLPVGCELSLETKLLLQRQHEELPPEACVNTQIVAKPPGPTPEPASGPVEPASSDPTGAPAAAEVA